MRAAKRDAPPDPVRGRPTAQRRPRRRPPAGRVRLRPRRLRPPDVSERHGCTPPPSTTNATHPRRHPRFTSMHSHPESTNRSRPPGASPPRRRRPPGRSAADAAPSRRPRHPARSTANVGPSHPHPPPGGFPHGAGRAGEAARLVRNDSMRWPPSPSLADRLHLRGGRLEDVHLEAARSRRDAPPATRASAPRHSNDSLYGAAASRRRRWRHPCTREAGVDDDARRRGGFGAPLAHHQLAVAGRRAPVHATERVTQRYSRVERSSSLPTARALHQLGGAVAVDQHRTAVGRSTTAGTTVRRSALPTAVSERPMPNGSRVLHHERADREQASAGRISS